MHKKGSKIYNVGFNLKLCGPDKAVAFENNPKTKHCEVNTLEVTKGSPLFAKYKPGNIRGGSCGCSHLNQWLAAVADGTQTPFPKNLADHGSDNISTRRVMEHNEQLATTLEKGLTWTMIKWEIEEAYPQLPHIFQRALNVEHHIGEGLLEEEEEEDRGGGGGGMDSTLEI